MMPENSPYLTADQYRRLMKLGYPYTDNADYQCIALEWLRTARGIFIELIPDMWGDDNCVSEHMGYRIFVWQVGKPKPGVADDLGMLPTPQQAYSNALDHILDTIIYE